jgi:hypothetical protein
MRKIQISLLFVLLVCVATSCIETKPAQTTPQMAFGNLYVNPQFIGDSLIGAKDTLFSHYNEELGILYLDTLTLHDTIVFPSYFSSNMNNLVSIKATYDTINVDMWFDIDPNNADVKKALAAGSDHTKGLLLFNPMYSMVSFPIYIVPQNAGAYPIKIEVTSDSEFPTNSIQFTVPVK